MSCEFIGNSSTLGLTIQWEHDRPSTPMAATRGWLGVYVGGNQIWSFGGPGTESWPWIELLEFLARNWRYLLHEVGGDPLGLSEPLDCVWNAAEDRWASKSDADRGREEESLAEYLRTHDLSEALCGALAPSLFVERLAPVSARVSARGVQVTTPWSEIQDTLIALGNSIATRLNGLNDERSTRALTAWRDRDGVSPEDLIATAMGRPAGDVARLARVLPMVRQRQKRFAPYAVAARMVPDTVPIEELAPFFEAFLSVEGRASEALIDIRGQASAVRARLEAEGRRRYAIGYELARWFREDRGIDLRQSIDLDSVLKALGVHVVDVTVDRPEIDAFAALGSEQPPTIVINARGRHAAGQLGRRATLAHELCHLLVDLGITLPEAEAQSVRAPRHAEQRARAFAAELLFAQEVAAEEKPLITEASVESDVRRLVHRFHASHEIVLWQLLNAPGQIALEVEWQLKEWVDELRVE